jgi:hypothetical protein
MQQQALAPAFPCSWPTGFFLALAPEDAKNYFTNQFCSTTGKR